MSKSAVRWLLGMEGPLSFALPHQLQEQMPGLTLISRRRPIRPDPAIATSLRLDGLSYPLRTEMGGSVALALMQVAERLGTSQTAVVQWVIGPSSPSRVLPTEFRLSEALGLRPPSEPDISERQAWTRKVQEPVFAVIGRIGASARSPRAAGGIIRQLYQALSLGNSANAQFKNKLASTATARHLISVTGQRRRWSGIVNASELGMLLGWPIDGVRAPGHVGPSLAPAPADLLIPDDSPAAEGRTLGESLHPADEGQAVGMPSSANTSHLHVIGPTGSGKSTLLSQMVLADAAAGHGVLVLEPRGDLVMDILARLPKHRHKDVVVIEPNEFSPVVGINPILGPTAQAERRADEILDLFRTLFGTAVGPRSSDVLLHTLITAARLPDGSMTDVPTLLTNPNFRRRSLVKVTDQLVLAPFWAWYENLSDAERSQVIAPLLNKLRAFTTRAVVRRMLGQPEPKFDLESLFTKNCIILVNLNRGLIGPGTSRLIGSLLLTQLWQTIQRRGSTAADQRHPVSVVIDEWQDYVGALDFGEVLAQARGLGVGVTLAHQHLGQLNQTLRAAVVANARSRVSFRPSQRDASALAAALGGGVTATDLEALGPYQAIARLHTGRAASQPFAIRTLRLGPPTNDAEELRSKSQKRYGVDGATVDNRLRIRWQGGADTSGMPVGVSRRQTP